MSALPWFCSPQVDWMGQLQDFFCDAVNIMLIVCCYALMVSQLSFQFLFFFTLPLFDMTLNFDTVSTPLPGFICSHLAIHAIALQLSDSFVFSYGKKLPNLHIYTQTDVLSCFVCIKAEKQSKNTEEHKERPEKPTKVAKICVQVKKKKTNSTKCL